MLDTIINLQDIQKLSEGLTNKWYVERRNDGLYMIRALCGEWKTCTLNPDWNSTSNVKVIGNVY